VKVQPQEVSGALVEWRRPGEEFARMERGMGRSFAEPFALEVCADEVGPAPVVDVSESENIQNDYCIARK
jgi:hypothetical protein